MNRMLSILVTGTCPIALALLTACSHEGPAPKLATYEPPPVAVQAPAPAPAAAPVQESVVHVSEDILSACKISDAQTGDAPLFAFDSSALSRPDQRLLHEVAQCVTAGPLEGRSLALVGRADPRGTEAYNMRLGERRAVGVERYLERLGMPSDKVRESSRGNLDATGHDEQGWQKDRRVDVDLAT